MNPDEILEILVAHGVPGAVIVRVAMLISESQLTESRKTKNRERMQTVRARARTQVHTNARARTQAVNHSSTTENTTNSDDAAKKPTNIEERKKEEGSKFSTRSARTKKTMTPLPVNWHPELAGDFEFQKFSDHARQNDRHCADWEAAWRNWNRNKSKFDAKGGNGNGRRHGSVLDAADRLIEKLGGEEAVSRYVPGSEGPRPLDLDSGNGPPNLRLIPKR